MLLAIFLRVWHATAVAMHLTLQGKQVQHLLWTPILPICRRRIQSAQLLLGIHDCFENRPRSPITSRRNSNCVQWRNILCSSIFNPEAVETATGYPRATILDWFALVVWPTSVEPSAQLVPQGEETLPREKGRLICCGLALRNNVVYWKTNRKINNDLQCN